MDIAIGCNFITGDAKGRVRAKKAFGMVMDKTNTRDIALFKNEKLFGTKKKVQEVEGPEL